MSALPKALAKRGHRVMAVAPRYEHYAEGWETGARIRIRVYDKEHEVRRRFLSLHRAMLIIIVVNLFGKKAFKLEAHCKSQQ